MPAHALVAEDDPAVRSVVAALLASDGFEVCTAAGAEALAALLNPVGPALAVAVVDCVMPSLSGPGLLKRARAANARRRRRAGRTTRARSRSFRSGAARRACPGGAGCGADADQRPGPVAGPG